MFLFILTRFCKLEFTSLTKVLFVTLIYLCWGLYCKLTMVYTCCVPECDTGYKSCKTTEKTQLFKIPSEHTVRRKWLDAIPRQDWVVTNNHRVCARHFTPDDFVTVSQYKRTIRKQQGHSSDKLQRPRLKLTAVPHVFPSLPGYLSKSNSAPRPTLASTSSARSALENVAIEKQNKEFLESGSFDNFNSFKQKILKETLPQGFISVAEDSCIQFHYLNCSAELLEAPKLLASVIITTSLQIHMFVSSAVIPVSAYKYLLSSTNLKTTTELTNLLALCKSICDNCSGGTSNSFSFSLAVSLLEQYILTEKYDEDSENSSMPLVKFVVEQLKLVRVPKTGRRYSSRIITTSFLWQLTSTSLYKKLQNLFILPSISRLRQLSACHNVESGKLDFSYLRQRTADLTQREQTVVLLVDEVYTAQRVEYSNGSFVGLTEEGVPAKTVLSFMVQSIGGKYQDIVCLIPVNKLDTSLLRTWFNYVMQGLHDIFLVVAVCADNHVCNR